MTDERIGRCEQAPMRNDFEVEVLTDAGKTGECLRLVIERIQPRSISFGDSITLYATGIIDWLRSRQDISSLIHLKPKSVSTS